MNEEPATAIGKIAAAPEHGEHTVLIFLQPDSLTRKFKAGETVIVTAMEVT